MSNFLTGLFGRSKQTQQPATALRINNSLQGVPIPLALGGLNRIAGTLIDYFNFQYQNAPSASSGGGKGGAVGAGGGKGNSGSYVYFTDFLICLCEASGSAGVQGLGAWWINGSIQSSATGGGAPPTQQELSFAGYEYFVDVFPGTYQQQPCGFAEQFDPSRNLPYRGLCYAAFASFPLGSSTSLPNITFEVYSPVTANVNGQPDGDPSLSIISFLTDPNWGVGFPRLGSLSLYQSYVLALGMLASPVIASPVVASSWLNDMLTATNSAAVWKDGLLTVVPYGDAAITRGQVQSITESHQVPANGYGSHYPSITVGNVATYAGDGGVSYQGGGALQKVATYAPTGVAGTGSPGVGQYYEQGGTYFFNLGDINQTVAISYDFAAAASYIPNTQPIYDFTYDDFLPLQGSIGQGLAPQGSPLAVVRKSRDQMLNNIQLTYLDRTNNYNPVRIEVKDEASIQAFKRERPSGSKTYDFFCLASAAQMSATLQLGRQQIARTFQWTCGRHFLLILELMAIATVTDPAQGLVRQPVRIIEIQENGDFTLTVTAEEFHGTASAPEYGQQATTGYAINYNADPGPTNAPLIFEPTDELGVALDGAGGLLVAAAVSGQNTALWGGCFVWASYDNANYKKVGEIVGPARMGVLSAPLPSTTVNPTGLTIDQANVLSVDLTESGGTLASGTVQDATSFATRCIVGAGASYELLAYETAALTAASKYALTYLVRGIYGSEAEVAAHPTGTPFARLDANILPIPYQPSDVGATIYLKFQSFNVYQGGLQSLANVPAVAYPIAGLALSSPLPNVVNLRTVFDVNSGFTEIDWDEVTDFRSVVYEIRSGTSPAAAMTLGTVAHPPFRVPGDGEYWVAARAQPVAGLTVYSEAWQSVTIAGAVITQNVILTVDLKALNWPGTFTGGAGIDNTLNAIRTGGGNILTDPNVLTTPDILNYGAGTALAGIYYPDDHAYLDIGYVTTASVAMKFQPTGVPIGQNILTVGNVLTDPDILGSASTQFINNYPLINTATTAGGDLYSLGDLYQYPDLYAIGDANWNGWQRFSPGTYQTRFLDFAFSLSTIDPNTISYDLAWTITITIPARIDTFAVTTSASADTVVTFQPTGAASPAAFNGGPGAGNTPILQWAIINAAAGDDFIVTAGPTLSSVSFKVLNGGSRVVRNINLTAEGF